MYRRDYMIRLIERFARALIAVRNRVIRRELTQEELRREIAEVGEQAGLDLDTARQLDPQTLLMWLAPTGDIDEPKFWLLAELLYLEGIEGRTMGTGDAGHADLARARAIFARLPPDWQPAEGLTSARERIAEIDRLLRNE